MQDPYRVLGVSPQATDEEIKKILSMGNEEEPILYAICGEISKKANYSLCVLLATKAHIFSYDFGSGECSEKYAFEDIEDIYNKRMYGNGIMRLKFKDGTSTELFRFTFTVTALCDAAVTYIKDIGNGESPEEAYKVMEAVYEKMLSVCQFKEILDHNFEGNEELRLYLLQSLPKYGNDNDEIDGYFGAITSHIVDECKKYKGVCTNGNLIPSVFCWIMHEQFGRRTKATPDGRKAGFPLGDGSGPCQGREMAGPTASILSSTKWDHSELIGGVAVNMKFSKSALGKQSLDVMKALIKVYMQRGGFEMQINVTDRETLEKARANPEAYRDLVVRIGGYSDYFTKLSPEMQDEIILRTEHDI